MRGVLPLAPALRRSEAQRRVGLLVEKAVVDSDEVAVSLEFGDAPAKPCPLLGEESSALVVEPMDVGRPRQSHRSEYELADGVRVALGVGERQRRAPREAPDEPAFDREVGSQSLEIGDQMLRRVRGEIRLVVDGRQAATGAALIEQDDPIRGRIEHTPHPGRTARTGSAVKDDCWPAVRIPAHLPVDLLTIAEIEQAMLVRLDRRESAQHDRAAGIARCICTITDRRRQTRALGSERLLELGGYRVIQSVLSR